MEIIKLNLIPSGVNPVCHCSQYDTERVIRAELFDGLTPYSLASGDEITLNVRKPDNTIVTTTVETTQGNNYVDLTTTEQICACTGENLCDLTLTNGNKKIGTLNFIMIIERDVLADGIESQSVIKDLDALVQEAVGDNFYTKTEVDDALALKADKSTTYTKTQVDSALASKANSSDVYTKAQVDTALSAKASASEVEDIRIGADGKTYASAGDAVREQVNDLSLIDTILDNKKVDNPNVIITVATGESQSGLVGTGGQTYAGYDNHTQCSVEMGEEYYLTGKNFGAPYLFWFIKDADNQVIASFSGSTGNYTDEKVIIPRGGATLFVNGAQVTYIAKINKKTYTPTDMTSIVNQLNNKVDSFYKIVDWAVAQANSGLVGTGGQTYAGYDNHAEVNVAEGETYYVSGKNYGSPYLLWFVLNSSNQVVSSFSGAAGKYKDQEVIIPTGGVKLMVNGAQSVAVATVKKKIPMDSFDYISNVAAKLPNVGVAFGDSVMEGVGVLNLDDTVPTKDAVSVMSEYLGTKVYNGGIGGTSYNNGETGNFTVIADAIASGDWSLIDTKIANVISQNPNQGFGSLTAQYAAIKALDFNKVDFIVLGYGTNDLTFGASLDNDQNLLDKTTILGALRYGVKTILQSYPHLIIYVFTPCFRYDIGSSHENSDVYINPQSGLSLPDISNGIFNCCKELHIPCDNLYFKSNLNDYTKTVYLSDGVHRNAKGYKLLGIQYSKFIAAN